MSFMMAFGWAGIMLCMGMFLRVKIPAFRKMLVPTGVIAGILGIIFMNVAMGADVDVGTDMEMFTSIVNHQSDEHAAGRKRQCRKCVERGGIYGTALVSAVQYDSRNCHRGAVSYEQYYRYESGIRYVDSVCVLSGTRPVGSLRSDF